MIRTDKWRFIAGILAIIVLACTSVLLPRWGFLRQKAVVEASQTFSLSSIANGGYEWNLRDGQPARGEGLVKERVQNFNRSDLMELELAQGLLTGDIVQEGQVLAAIHSPRLQSGFDQIRAERDALVAERALLAAGSRPEEIEEARRAVELARTIRDGERLELEKTRTLAQQGAISNLDLETAELQDRIRGLEIDLADAQLAVARSSARPEALSSLDAEIAAVNSRVDEIQALLDANTITSPIQGILEVGGNRVVLRVYNLDRVFLRVPIPESERLAVEKGAEVAFVTDSSPDRVFEGKVVDLGEDASTLNGLQVFWVSVEIDNPDHVLRSGMTGVARIRLSEERGFIAWIQQAMAAY